jgi:hypothetical protein
MSFLLTNKEAVPVFNKFDMFDGECGHGVFPSCPPLVVMCKPVLGGWVFSKQSGEGIDFQLLMGGIDIEKGREVEMARHLCKSELLEDRRRGFKELEEHVRLMGIGELVNLGLAEKDEEIRNCVSKILICLLSPPL